ncbi:hypothetical protein [Bifidobacterium avesanii]|uniref:DUF3800 domain-containing protein n=1 Tax=Bifidobacterium avesanii TaxID=1798157 RepID=A0A7K3TLV1_9BIFI|nr:hypothetical protein [Bifidobacterium avesanii]KAB8288519.1 hypothetical protein DSM100685_1727 [Bifidobacterium avesanii]NEG79243.1 hypothetical protein [Bifidobacterium avesanii]
MNASTAWGDESIRHKGMPLPSYLLCACIVEDPDQARNTLMRIKPRNAGKLHWRQMTTRDKSASMEAIASLDTLSFIIVAEQADGVNDERARRKCLERLLRLLEAQGITMLTLESRTPIQDKRDRQYVAYLHTNHTLHAIKLSHAIGADEPCLWLPDQILGAYGDTRSHESDFSGILERITLEDVFSC